MAKAQYIGVSGVARKVKQPYVGVSGVARKVKSGYVGVSGVARQFFQGGVPASSLAVGSSVYLKENGTNVEYLVVHQGNPSTSLYDASCNGIWLLRKDIYSNHMWNSGQVNDYENSEIHSYLNSTYLNLLDSGVRNAVKQVKIPYRAGSGYDKTVTSGESGLSTKIFLLSCPELDWTSSDSSYICNDGTCLSYFNGAASSKKVAYLNGTETMWWTRSPYCRSSYGYKYSIYVSTGGSWSQYYSDGSLGIRPALILPSTALFDPDTLEFVSA